MTSIFIIIVILCVLSLVWSLVMGAIKLALIIGIALVVIGAIKAFLGKSNGGS